MTVLMTLLPDLLLLAILIFFAWRGAARGLILTLCSMLAVLVALVGAIFLTRALTPLVAPHIEPMVYSALEEAVAVEVTGAGESLEPDSPLWEMLRQSEWYNPVTDAVRGGVEELVAQTLRGASAAIAEIVTQGGIFLVSFLLLSLIWFLLSHALDLAFRLPVLRTFNTGGGLLVGLVKGIVVAYALVFALGRIPGALPQARVEETFLLRYLAGFNPLSLIPLIRGVTP